MAIITRSPFHFIIVYQRFLIKVKSSSPFPVKTQLHARSGRQASPAHVQTIRNASAATSPPVAAENRLWMRAALVVGAAVVLAGTGALDVDECDVEPVELEEWADGLLEGPAVALLEEAAMAMVVVDSVLEGNAELSEDAMVVVIVESVLATLDTTDEADDVSLRMEDGELVVDDASLRTEDGALVVVDVSLITEDGALAVVDDMVETTDEYSLAREDEIDATYELTAELPPVDRGIGTIAVTLVEETELVGDKDADSAPAMLEVDADGTIVVVTVVEATLSEADGDDEVSNGKTVVVAVVNVVLSVAGPTGLGAILMDDEESEETGAGTMVVVAAAVIDELDESDVIEDTD
ncbi:hypothetical protein LTR66_009259 [Elasticomyces elasticus]|nr:hypothetical protein LTR28_003993 [Elasticomyces elasticus]KAK4982465.1 hypothetical protein LTR66_009259 [Elasticomyces elasticus]